MNASLSKMIVMSFLFGANAFGASFVTGVIIDKGGNQFEVDGPYGKLEIRATESILNSLSSLANPTFVKQSNGKPYSYEFKGEVKGKTFELAQTPTNIPGPERLQGVVSYDESTGKFKIGKQVVEYGYTKVLNGYEFDDISKSSYIGKNVIAEGELLGDVFVMQALTPVGLFSATKDDKTIYDKDFKKNPYNFIKKQMYSNEISQSSKSFRKTVYEEKGYSVSPGESVFLVTLSGRQGDSFGAVNGHFVAGLGEVKEDLSIRGEVSNAYVVNGKDILSGNTSLTNYFSNLVQGQNNYRPTYSFLVYGIDKEKLQKFRDFLEPSHIEFRTKDLEITLDFNCTTETAKGLSLAGIVANHKRTLGQRVFDLNHLAYPLRLASVLGEAGEALGKTASGDKEDFQPRPAFHSYIDTLKNKKVIKELGIKRMDYVFYAQIPSARPVGGAPSNYTFHVGVKHDSLFYKKLYDKYENNSNKSDNLSAEELLEYLPLLNKVD
ncbi:MAG: hypothetical protein K9K67_14005 [Bacteriovoracaceae bacterium]|nr:hypothetical protein [Bacteriovoracaceae bacterium]